jgi:hypothetical protein
MIWVPRFITITYIGKPERSSSLRTGIESLRGNSLATSALKRCCPFWTTNTVAGTRNVKSRSPSSRESSTRLPGPRSPGSPEAATGGTGAAGGAGGTIGPHAAAVNPTNSRQSIERMSVPFLSKARSLTKCYRPITMKADQAEVG